MGGPDGLNPEDPGVRLLGATLQQHRPDLDHARALLAVCGDVPAVGDEATRWVLDVREPPGARHRCVALGRALSVDVLDNVLAESGDEQIAAARWGGPFDAALIWPRAHHGMDFAHWTLAAAACRLRPGGLLLCAARKQKGAKRLQKFVASLLGDARVLGRGGGYQVSGRARADRERRRARRRCRWCTRGIRCPWGTPSLELRAGPGVFSRRSPRRRHRRAARSPRRPDARDADAVAGDRPVRRGGPAGPGRAAVGALGAGAGRGIESARPRRPARQRAYGGSRGSGDGAGARRDARTGGGAGRGGLRGPHRSRAAQSAHARAAGGPGAPGGTVAGLPGTGGRGARGGQSRRHHARRVRSHGDGGRRLRERSRVHRARGAACLRPVRAGAEVVISAVAQGGATGRRRGSRGPREVAGARAGAAKIVHRSRWRRRRRCSRRSC